MIHYEIILKGRDAGTLSVSSVVGEDAPSAAVHPSIRKPSMSMSASFDFRGGRQEKTSLSHVTLHVTWHGEEVLTLK